MVPNWLTTGIRRCHLKAKTVVSADVPLTLTRPTNKSASSSRAVKLMGMVRSNSGSLSLTSVTTMSTVVVDVWMDGRAQTLTFTCQMSQIRSTENWITAARHSGGLNLSPENFNTNVLSCLLQPQKPSFKSTTNPSTFFSTHAKLAPWGRGSVFVEVHHLPVEVSVFEQFKRSPITSQISGILIKQRLQHQN